MTTATDNTMQLPMRYGQFGGCYVPETLVPALAEVEGAFVRLRDDAAFNAELDALLANYAGRPTPLYRCANLSADLGIQLWLKREDLLHGGAHKTNNALGQGLLAKHMGKQRLIAETGAGQHGFATAMIGALLGLPTVIYMGAVDVSRQRQNVLRMRLCGAEVIPVETGGATLKDAINDAMRDWITNIRTTTYIFGTAAGPHPFPAIVRHFQSVIGREARAQFEQQVGGTPDYVVACVGGGSNAIGIFSAFLGSSTGVSPVSPPAREVSTTADLGTTNAEESAHSANGGHGRDAHATKLIGVEPAGDGIDTARHGAPLAKGEPGVFHGALSMLLQTDDGQILETHSAAAGLDYPGVGPEHAALQESGAATYTHASDAEALDAFQLLCRREGIIPALESAHALAAVVRMRKAGEIADGTRVLINLSGRGDKDLDQVEELLASQDQT